MKRTAKLLALVLALATVMTFGLTFASAADINVNGELGENAAQINIVAKDEGDIYNAYRLLDFESLTPSTQDESGVDQNNGTGVYRLNTKWKEFWKDTSDNGGNAFVNIDDNQYVTAKTTFDAAEVAKRARQWAIDHSTCSADYGPSTAATGEGDIIHFNNVELGYYLIDTTTGTLCALQTPNAVVTAVDKNDVPKVEKKVYEDGWKTESDGAIGDEVEFQLTVEIKAGAQGYKLTDTLTKMSYVGTTITVKNGDTTLTQDEGTTENDYKFTLAEDEHGFELLIHDTYLSEHAGKSPLEKLVITYKATIDNDAAIAGNGNDNKVVLNYGKNSSLEANTEHTTTYVWEFSIFKFHDDNQGLESAHFTIKKGDQTLAFKDEGSGVYRYNLGTVTDLVSPSGGVIEVKGLDSGTYTITETDAPDGYTKLVGDITITINSDGTISLTNHTDVTLDNKQVKIENKSGGQLPTTGGTGTKALVAIGSILVLVSVIFLVTKKKMSTYVA